MDVGGLFAKEVLRPLATIIVPGMLAAVPWLGLLLAKYEKVAELAAHNPGLTLLVALLSAMAAGLTLEDLGAEIETRCWDRRLQKKYPGHAANWHAYLATTFADEPEGKRYLHDVFLRFKFELGTGLAVVPGLVGLVVWQRYEPFMSWTGLYVACGVGVALASFLLFQSYRSAETLSDVRSILVNGRSQLEPSTD